MFVLIANEQEVVKECIVVKNNTTASVLFDILRDIYGSENVAMCSRGLDDVPVNIQQAAYHRLSVELDRDSMEE